MRLSDQTVPGGMNAGGLGKAPPDATDDGGMKSGECGSDGMDSTGMVPWIEEMSCCVGSRDKPSGSGGGRPLELGGRELDRVPADDKGGGTADISPTEVSGGGGLDSG